MTVVRDLLPALERSAGFHRKLDEIVRCHLVGDEEAVDLLVASVDVAELRAAAVELESVVVRDRIFSSPPPPLPEPARHLAVVPAPDAHSRKV